MKIEKKIWLEYFRKILDGSKNFEPRLAIGGVIRPGRQS